MRDCGRTIDPLLLKNPKSTLSEATPIVRTTTHWYLTLSKFEKPLQEWLAQKSDWRPTVVNFALGQIREGLPERSMTRDLTWGIPVPLDDPDAAGRFSMSGSMRRSAMSLSPRRCWSEKVVHLPTLRGTGRALTRR